VSKFEYFTNESDETIIIFSSCPKLQNLTVVKKIPILAKSLLPKKESTYFKIHKRNEEFIHHTLNSKANEQIEFNVWILASHGTSTKFIGMFDFAPVIKKQKLLNLIKIPSALGLDRT
jgi:hypothetical protein